MDAILGSARLGKMIVACVVLCIFGLVIMTVRLISGSYLLGVVVLVGLLWWLLREVGGFVMYPGSFFLTRSDIEMRYSREIGVRMVACFNALHALSLCIMHRKYEPYQHNNDFVVAIDRHTRAMTAMLEMFQNSLSNRKINLLRNYRQLRAILQVKDGDKPCIFDLIARPRLISSISQQDLNFYRLRFAEITPIIKEMAETMKSYVPPTGTFQLMRFRMSEENLYEIRFGFYNWNVLYNYDLFSIHSTGNAHIQSAIIHNTKKRAYLNDEQEQPQQNTSKKAILFCNPNGVFIQFFGADNEYVTNYLKMGYNVILWNYRGYGQSTGNPSIKYSQQDALSVYRFYRSRGYEIEIVHGYSIGGAAAVGLMEQLAMGKQLPGDKVEILIVDRSFSSIGEMSIQFGSAIHSLTRLIFFTDNIDLSHQFEAATCRKLLVWDYCDQVIPDKASVKNRIIKRRKRSQDSINGRKVEEDDRVQLTEEVSFGSLQNTVHFEEVAKQLQWTVSKLLQLRKNSDSSDKELDDVLEEREASVSTTGGLEEANFDALVRIIGKVDGGGIELFHNVNQLEEIHNKKPEYFLHICESYVLGLVCYGSYFPLRPILHDHARIKAQTLAKIDHLLRQLGERVTRAAAFSRSSDPSAAQIQRNFAAIFQRLRQLVQECFGEEWFALHGSLLPTNNGHNNSLTGQEFEVLNEFIRSSLGRQAEPGHLQEMERMIS